MLGYLKDYPIAEISNGKGYCGGDWHLAIHRNDVRDTIAYHTFYTKEDAVQYAIESGIPSDDIYFAKGNNGYVGDNEVKFVCCKCKKKFDYGGGFIHYGETRNPICGDCISKITHRKR